MLRSVIFFLLAPRSLLTTTCLRLAQGRPTYAVSLCLFFSATLNSIGAVFHKIAPATVVKIISGTMYEPLYVSENVHAAVDDRLSAREWLSVMK